MTHLGYPPVGPPPPWQFYHPNDISNNNPSTSQVPNNSLLHNISTSSQHYHSSSPSLGPTPSSHVRLIPSGSSPVFGSSLASTETMTHDLQHEDNIIKDPIPLDGEGVIIF